MSNETDNQFELVANRIGKVFRSPDGASLPVLENVSVRVASGETVCFLGSSGCGKTTLLNILAGLDGDYTGEVTNSLINNNPLRIGYMPQSAALLPWRTVAANVRLGLEFMQVPHEAADTRVQEALREVGLEQFSSAYPMQLSGGMCQRAALARTLAVQPQLLVLDEPLAHLDFVSRRALAIKVQQHVRNNSCAAIVATHSIEEAAVMATRVIVLRGRPARVETILQVGDDHYAGERGIQVCKSVGELFDRITDAFGTTPETTK